MWAHTLAALVIGLDDLDRKGYLKFLAGYYLILFKHKHLISLRTTLYILQYKYNNCLQNASVFFFTFLKTSKNIFRKMRDTTKTFKPPSRIGKKKERL